jgi:hypothetical protein
MSCYIDFFLPKRICRSVTDCKDQVLALFSRLGGMNLQHKANESRWNKGWSTSDKRKRTLACVESHVPSKLKNKDARRTLRETRTEHSLRRFRWGSNMRGSVHGINCGGIEKFIPWPARTTEKRPGHLSRGQLGGNPCHSPNTGRCSSNAHIISTSPSSRLVPAFCGGSSV